MTPSQKESLVPELEQIFPALKEKLDQAVVPMSEHQRGRIDRFVRVLVKVRQVINDMDFDFASFGAVDQIRSSLVRISDQLNAAVSGDPGAVNYDSVDAEADAIMDVLPRLGFNLTTLEKLDQYRAKVQAEQENVSTQLAAARERAENELNLFIAEGRSMVEKVGALKFDSQSLAEIAAGRALRGEFADRAKTEKYIASRWTLATWFFAILTTAILIYVFIAHLLGTIVSKDTDLQLLGTQALITASLGLIAKWTSKRANRHLTEEAKYHRLAVNMQTIDSFIAKIDPPYNNIVRSEIAIKMFSDPTVVDTPTDFESSPLGDTLKTLLERPKP